MINISKRIIAIESDYYIEMHEDTGEENIVNPPYYDCDTYDPKNPSKNNFYAIFYTTAYIWLYKNLVIFAGENAFNKRRNPTVNLRTFNHILLNFKAKYIY